MTLCCRHICKADHLHSLNLCTYHQTWLSTPKTKQNVRKKRGKQQNAKMKEKNRKPSAQFGGIRSVHVRTCQLLYLLSLTVGNVNLTSMCASYVIGAKSNIETNTRTSYVCIATTLLLSYSLYATKQFGFHYIIILTEISCPILLQIHRFEIA